MHRRDFGRLVGGAALAPVWSCRRAAAPPQSLAQILGLEGAERSWIERLTPDERRELREALERPADQSRDRAADRLFSIVGSRSRLFAFVHYPPVNDQRGLCDGLLQE